MRIPFARKVCRVQFLANGLVAFMSRERASARLLAVNRGLAPAANACFSKCD
jgi:hypothetical protein